MPPQVPPFTNKHHKHKSIYLYCWRPLHRSHCDGGVPWAGGVPWTSFDAADCPCTKEALSILCDPSDVRHIAFPIINWLLLLHSSCMEVLIRIISAHIRNIIWFDLIWLVELASLPYSTLFIIFYIWWVMQSMSAQQCRINQHCQCEYIYFLMHHLWSLLYFKLFSFGPEENEYRSQIVVKVTSLASFSIENNGKKKSKDGCNSVLKINIGRAIFLS